MLIVILIIMRAKKMWLFGITEIALSNQPKMLINIVKVHNKSAVVAVELRAGKCVITS